MTSLQMDKCLLQDGLPDWNPLLRAVSLLRLRLTRLLLEGGAYVNESDRLGHTPLMVALRTAHRDPQSTPRHRMVRYLLECGADPNIQDKSGKTALIHAVLEAVELQTLALLVGGGADPSLPDHLGSSALVYAVSSGNRDTLRLLVDACRERGKEVIIITTTNSPTGQQCKQFVSSPKLDQSHFCSSENECRSPSQGASASTTPRPGSPLLDAHGTTAQTDLGSTSNSEDTKRRPFCRRHSIDVRDCSGPLSSLQSSGHRKRILGRKMSYDSATTSAHSASHPNLHQETDTLKPDEGGVISTLKNVICLRRFEHYNSDSQLPQFESAKTSGAIGKERRKPVNACSQEPGANRALFERRGSGALLLDHITHTRPGFLPPLNPRAPIPHIGVSSGSGLFDNQPPGVSSFPLSYSRRSSLTSTKSLLPFASPFPKDLNVEKTLHRRHSMQSDQIKELSNYDQPIGR